MPALAAAQVIDLFAACLAPTAANGAKTDRTAPVAQASLPMWKVYAGDEAIEPITLDGQIQQHELEVRCEGLVSAVQNVDDAMHNLARDGLAALNAAPLSPQVTRADAGVTRNLAPEYGADVARITLRQRAVFQTNPSQPDVLL